MPGRRANRLRREVILLAVLVIVVDAGFVAGYVLAGLRAASATMKVGYTVLWTAVTLFVVLRGLGRIRSIRSGA